MKRTVTLNLCPGAQTVGDPADSDNPGVWHISGFMPVSSLPPGLPDDPNARVANLRARNASAIRDSARRNDGKFHLKNKGITILASEAVNLGGNSFALSLETGLDGIVDGGHTYSVLQSELGAGTNLDRQYVPVFVRVGCPPGDLADICEGLNTSVQVSAAGLMARVGLYSWLQDELNSSGVPANVSWRDNEEGDITAEHVIRVIATANPGAFPAGHPVVCYTSPGALMARYREFHSSFVAMSPIVADVLRAYDRMSTDLVVEFRRQGRFDDALSRGSVMHTPLFDPQVQLGVARVPSSISLAATAGLRAWVVQNVNGAYVFDRPSVQLLEDIRSMYSDIVQVSVHHLDRHGGNSHAMGADYLYWDALFALFRNRRSQTGDKSSPVNEQDLERFRELYRAQLNEALARTDEMPASSETPQQALLRQQAELASAGIGEVLSYLENGGFGNCATCQGDVESYRLERWASALRCSRCAIAR